MLCIEAVTKEAGCYFNTARNMLLSKSGKDKSRIVMEMAYRYTNKSQKEIGKIFGVDHSTVSQNRKRLRIRLEKDIKLQKAFEETGEILDNCQNERFDPRAPLDIQ